MTLRDFIAKLQALPHEAMDLPVCLADWNEQYRAPDEAAAEAIRLEECHYWPEGGREPRATLGRIVLIGDQ